MIKKLSTPIYIAMLCMAACKHPQKYVLDKAANAAMAQILDSIAKQNFNKDNPFSPGAQLVYFNDKLKKDSGNDYLLAVDGYYKADALLKIGREKEAIDFIAQLPKSLLLNKSGLDVKTEELYALANLRYGERMNCINNHMAESCIFPIVKGGMHHDETGSRKAIAIYQDLLTKNPSDLASRWLLNIAYMTLGEYPQKVPAQFLIPRLDVDSSRETVKPFTDIAADLKFDTPNNAGGVVIDDFNNDGYLDIITSSWNIADGPMHFFLNNKNGGFADVTQQSGLGVIKGGLNMIQADYNNDGYIDILLLRGAWLPHQFGKQPVSLLRNNGNGTFTDVTATSGLLAFHPSQTAAWRDFNNDGYLDLFIGNETSNADDPQPCELFINNHDGTFTDVAKQAGCDITDFVKGVTVADYNNDGLQDIYLSTWSNSRILLKNEGIQNGAVHFTNVTHEAGLDDIKVKTFPTWFWDYDNDGWPDIFVCGYQPAKSSVAYSMAAESLGKPDPEASLVYLYHNNHDGTFTNVSKQMGLNMSVFSMGANFGDFDNDGYLDAYLGTGNPDYQSLEPSKLLKNMQGKRFVDVTASARVGNLQKGHGVSFADVDNDGDQDLFCEVGGAYPGDKYYNSFFLNPGQNNNHWISIALQGTEGNFNAIGARIKLSFKENGITRNVYRDENSGGSFGCSPLRKEIGIGQANMIDEITITWPGSGQTQTVRNVKPNRFIKIKQGSTNVEEINLKVLDFNSQHKDKMDMPM